jgi:hypothetical protein
VKGGEWQVRRREFNHDWLKNRFIVALNSWLRLLDGAIEDSILENSFLAEVLPQWEARRSEASDLIREFEKEMSPRTLLAEPPLSRCDGQTKQWLGELIHGLWLVRVAAKELTASAESCVAAADAAYAELTQAVKIRPKGELLPAMKPHRHLFERFRDACQKLGAAMSEFPHEIKVV